VLLPADPPPGRPRQPLKGDRYRDTPAAEAALGELDAGAAQERRACEDASRVPSFATTIEAERPGALAERG
jgi:hypothetical protein